jgi:hypothetical protein
MEWFANKYDIKVPEEWYKLNKSLISENGGETMAKKYGTFLRDIICED